MDVVLLERVDKLGHMGEVVSVKDGYARNYLLPQKKALRATRANLARFEAEKAHLEAKNADARTEAERLGADLDGQKFVIIRSASDAGALYGSVTTRDIATAVSEAGTPLDRRQVVQDKPVKELGLHPVRLRLHAEVMIEISINVARSMEEAEIQATGKTVADLRAEEEAAAEFDIAELFDDIGGAANDDDDGGEQPDRDAARRASEAEALGEDPRG